jgi:cation diffusion facilitator family transporter
MQKKEKITLLGIIVNALLFVAKLIVGYLSNSLAVMSDALNSLTDVISSIAIFIAVKVSSKNADEGHPFGHQRAEPIAGLIVAIMAGILGFEVIKTAIEKLITQEKELISLSAIYVLIFTALIKLGFSYYFIKTGKQMNSPAIVASGIDSRNDVFVSITALIGVVCSLAGYIYFDEIAAIAISFFIFQTGYKIGMENIDYLMGKAPPQKYIALITQTAQTIEGVKGLNDVLAHYVGNFIHIEIHIEVDKNLSTEQSHAIGKKVQHALEGIPVVDKAFIHIDPL